MDEIFDPFGDPVPRGGGRRGRPPHLPTSANRNRVNLLLALGWSNDRIAAALRITAPTLRRHYFSELRFREVARDRLDLRRIELLWREVEAGNVSAMKEFARFMERNDLMLYGQSAQPHRSTTPKPPKLGKKEAALAAAQTPDDGSMLGRLMAQRQNLN